MCAFEQSEKGMDFIMEKNIKSEEKLKKNYDGVKNLDM